MRSLSWTRLSSTFVPPAVYEMRMPSKFFLISLPLIVTMVEYQVRIP